MTPRGTSSRDVPCIAIDGMLMYNVRNGNGVNPAIQTTDLPYIHLYMS